MPESAAQRTQPSPPAHSGPGKKILVAEDNIINQKVALRLLSMLGYAADIAGDGAEALKLLEKGHYDAVLMDIQMPVMDGIETTRAIRRLNGVCAHVPIIAVTANAISGVRQKCMAAGMNDFLTKPIEIDQFASALQRWTTAVSGDTLLSA